MNYINSSINSIEDSTGIAQREINLFREYRTRLIADVVTGKIDVRHLAPSDPIPDDETENDEIADRIEDEDIREDDPSESAEEITGD